MKKIALLTDGVFPFIVGGMAKHSYYLAKYLAKRKIQVDLYHISSVEDIDINEYYEKQELDYISFTYVKFPKSIWFPGHYIFKSYILSKYYYEKIKNKKYDIIYAQGFTSWHYLKIEPLKKSIITNLHGLEMFQRSCGIKNYFENLLLRIPAKFILKNSFNTVSLGGLLTNIIKKNIHKNSLVHVIPNGIDLNVFDYKPSKIDQGKKLKLVFIGRVERRKGIEELTEFISSVIDTDVATFSFIGPIKLKDQIKHNNVQYYGLINDPIKIRDLLIESDILVCPSYSEGMPTVILEAMACGCAIFATDVGANRDLIDKTNGWIISTPPNISKLNKVWLKILSEDVSLFSKKKMSIEKVKNFSWDNVGDRTLKVFQKIMTPYSS